jgi:S-adenosylmethionine hydrolase
MSWIGATTGDAPAGSTSGIITLTSDFGLRDPFVGVMKGRILLRHPQARIIDLTHEVLAHWPAEAGFWLARSYAWFPAGTVHVAVVDPGVGTSRDIVLLESRGHWLLAPDNGLLEPIARADAASRAWRLDTAGLARCGVGRASATFHGRDIFAPVAAELSAGRVRPPDLGDRVRELVPSWVDEPSVADGRVAGRVITIDHFGNLITDIDASSVEGLREPVVHAGGLSLPLRRTYGDCAPGSTLALVNSFGVLELAVAEGRASDRLGLSRGAPVVVIDAVRRN